MITYGMSSHTLAKRLECSVQEADEIINFFYDGFPGVKKLTEESQKMLKEKGYVTDMWGRRRHIPDAQLPPYSITYTKGSYDFNPLIGAVSHIDNAIQKRIEYYQKQFAKVKNPDKIIKEAEKEGFKVVNNQGFISRAMRQCLNARIQGTAASMTKQAMVEIHRDKILNDLGFKLIVSVHDEVFGLCPTATSEEASKRLSEVMVNAAKSKCPNCPFKCDPYIVRDGWLEDENVGAVLNKYNKLIKDGKDKETALNTLYDAYPYFNKDSITLVCNQNYTIGVDSLKYGPKYYC